MKSSVIVRKASVFFLICLTWCVYVSGQENENLKKGKELINQGKKSQALQFLHKAGHEGCGEAFYLAGKIGGGDSNYVRGAELGYAPAQFEWGRLLTTQEYGRDYAKAFSMFQKSAEQGNTHALYALATFYYNGTHVDRDVLIATGYALKAAEKGHTDAMAFLAQISYINKDYASAYKWAAPSAEAGNPWGHYFLGALYFYGDHPDKDAMTTREAREKAINLFLKAADTVPISQCMLGDIYANGWGVEKDTDMAKQWYRTAAANGFQRAKEKLAELEKF